MKYTVTVEEDPDTGDLVLPLPTDLLNQMGWDIGDDLVWNDNFNGSFSLSKKVDKEQQKAYNVTMSNVDKKYYYSEIFHSIQGE